LLESLIIINNRIDILNPTVVIDDLRWLWEFGRTGFEFGGVDLGEFLGTVGGGRNFYGGQGGGWSGGGRGGGLGEVGVGLGGGGLVDRGFHNWGGNVGLLDWWWWVEV
jgi:hypothetical protein